MEAMTAGPPVIRSIGRCVLYLFASFGLWGFAWMWHTAKEVTPQVKPGSDPAVLRTVLMIVPIANLVVLFMSWDDIENYGKRAGVGGFNHIVWFVLGIIFSIPLLIGYVLAQNKMNAAHRAATNGSATDAPVYLADKITIGIGLLLWAIVLLVVIIAVAAS